MTTTNTRLLLFDINGTLITSGGAGVEGLKLALVERFGVSDDLSDIEIAGMTESGIVVTILNKHRIPATNENMTAFLDSYVRLLALELPRRKGSLMPGVLLLLERLKARSHLVLALLTGNLARGAQLKLEHYGVWNFFEFGTFADDHRDRNQLGALAKMRTGKTWARISRDGDRRDRRYAPRYFVRESFRRTHRRHRHGLVAAGKTDRTSAGFLVR